MKLNLDKPVVFFDIESTGLDIAKNSIIELCFVKLFPDGQQNIKTWRICPWDYEAGRQRPVEPSARKVHGISDEELENEPKFYEIADEVIGWIRDAELGGYNSQKFDLPMLAEEVERAGRWNGKDYGVDFHEKKMIDAQLIFFEYEPRNLKAAHRFYCGNDFENAHAAESDVLATVEVLEAQLDKYREGNAENGTAPLKNDIEHLASFASKKNKYVDFAGRLIRNDKGEIEVNFGKHKGKPAREVYACEPSYFDWIEKSDFMLDTKKQFRLLREQFEAEKKAEEKRRNQPLSGEQLDLFGGQLEALSTRGKKW